MSEELSKDPNGALTVGPIGLEVVLDGLELGCPASCPVPKDGVCPGGVDEFLVISGPTCSSVSVEAGPLCSVGGSDVVLAEGPGFTGVVSDTDCVEDSGMPVFSKGTVVLDSITVPEGCSGPV